MRRGRSESKVARVYANGLFYYLVSKTTVSSDFFRYVFASMKELNRVLSEEGRGAETILDSPVVEWEEKERLVNGLTECAVLRELLLLMAKKGRVHLFPSVYRFFTDSLWEHLGAVEGLFETPYPLSEDRREALERAVSKFLGRKVVGEFAVNKSLVAGVRVKVGSLVMEYSVRDFVECLRRRIEVEGK